MFYAECSFVNFSSPAAGQLNTTALIRTMIQLFSLPVIVYSNSALIILKNHQEHQKKKKKKNIYSIVYILYTDAWIYTKISNTYSIIYSASSNTMITLYFLREQWPGKSWICNKTMQTSQKTFTRNSLDVLIKRCKHPREQFWIGSHMSIRRCKHSREQSSGRSQMLMKRSKTPREQSPGWVRCINKMEQTPRRQLTGVSQMYQ